tara:strand:+ start:3111 stop:3575 length:465 start_codon:yes stop_codon:yes gene_type:complete
MAVTVVNLSDPISTLVTKTNTVSSDLGDKASLGTSTKTNLVAAINEINTKVIAIDTEAEIAAQVETFFNTQGNVLDVRGFHADSANIDSATITNLTSVNFNATKLTIDSAEFSTIKLDGAGSLSHLKSLAIKNSAGTTVLAGYILSTSNTDGTL